MHLRGLVWVNDIEYFWRFHLYINYIAFPPLVDCSLLSIVMHPPVPFFVICSHLCHLRLTSKQTTRLHHGRNEYYIVKDMAIRQINGVWSPHGQTKPSHLFRPRGHAFRLIKRINRYTNRLSHVSRWITLFKLRCSYVDSAII